MLSFDCLNVVSFFVVVFKNNVVIVKFDGINVLINLICISFNVLVTVLLVVKLDSVLYGLLLSLINEVNIFLVDVVVVEFIFLMKLILALFNFLF